MEFSNYNFTEILLNETRSAVATSLGTSTIVQNNLSVLFISFYFLLVIVVFLFHFEDIIIVTSSQSSKFVTTSQSNCNKIIPSKDIEKGLYSEIKTNHSDASSVMCDKKSCAVSKLDGQKMAQCSRCTFNKYQPNSDCMLQAESLQSSSNYNNLIGRQSNIPITNHIAHADSTNLASKTEDNSVESDNNTTTYIVHVNNDNLATDHGSSSVASRNNTTTNYAVLANNNNNNIEENDPFDIEVSLLVDNRNNNNEDDQPDYIPDLNNNNITNHILEFNFMMFELIETIQEVNSGIINFVIAMEQTDIANTDISVEEFNVAVDGVNRTTQIINAAVNRLSNSIVEYGHVNQVEENNNNNDDLHNFDRQRTMLNSILLELNHNIVVLNSSFSQQ